MANRTYDPLSHIPSPDVLREHLAQTEKLAGRLRILLDVSEQIHCYGDPQEQNPTKTATPSAVTDGAL